MKDAISVLTEWLLSCRHRRTGFPITRRNAKDVRGGVQETYVVCLDCGKQLSYDWSAMRIDPAA